MTDKKFDDEVRLVRAYLDAVRAAIKARAALDARHRELLAFVTGGVVNE